MSWKEVADLEREYREMALLEAEARAMMTPEERAADDAYLAVATEAEREKALDGDR